MTSLCNFYKIFWIFHVDTLLLLLVENNYILHIYITLYLLIFLYFSNFFGLLDDLLTLECVFLRPAFFYDIIFLDDLIFIFLTGRHCILIFVKRYKYFHNFYYFYFSNFYNKKIRPSAENPSILTFLTISIKF